MMQQSEAIKKENGSAMYSQEQDRKTELGHRNASVKAGDGTNNAQQSFLTDENVIIDGLQFYKGDE